MNLQTCFSPADRVIRLVIALIMAAFAVTAPPLWELAVPAGAVSLFLVYTVVTGSCPAVFTSRGAKRRKPNTLGYPEALQDIQL